MTSRGSRLLAVVRFLRRIPTPLTSREEAIALASKEMSRLGWKREAGAPVFEHLRHWLLYAQDAPACGNMAVYVDMRDGSTRAYTERGMVGSSPGPEETPRSEPGTHEGPQ